MSDSAVLTDEAALAKRGLNTDLNRPAFALMDPALAATLRGLSNDVYFQVALLTTIGLSSKNAILIVEFAESAVDEGD